MASEEEFKQLKIRRRNAKSALTRQGKALTQVINAKRTETEVRDCLEKCKSAYDDLIAKHEEFMQCIDNDDEFEEHEGWLDECQDQFMKLDFVARDYIIGANGSGKENVEQIEDGSGPSNANPHEINKEIAATC